MCVTEEGSGTLPSLFERKPNLLYMLRQERRRKTREAVKDLEKARKLPEFKAMALYFSRLERNQEEYLLLKDGKHPDEKKTAEYNHFLEDMKTYIGLEQRVEYLESLKPKK